MFIKIQGVMLMPGVPEAVPFATTEWAEVVEAPTDGFFYWTGEVVINGITCQWDLYHVLAMPLPGIDWFLVIQEVGGGLSQTQWHYDVHDHPTTHGIPLTGDVFSDSSPPLGPVGAFCVNMRRWHEM